MSTSRQENADHVAMVTPVITPTCLCPQTRLRVQHVVSETPSYFLQHIQHTVCIDRKPLRWSGTRDGDTVALSLSPSILQVLC